MTTNRVQVEEAVQQLVDRYRQGYLWFPAARLLPDRRRPRRRALDCIERHGDLEAFRLAATLRQWLATHPQASDVSAGATVKDDLRVVVSGVPWDAYDDLLAPGRGAHPAGVPERRPRAHQRAAGGAEGVRLPPGQRALGRRYGPALARRPLLLLRRLALPPARAVGGLAWEKSGTLRFRLDGGSQAVAHKIIAAEARSESVCEERGAPRGNAAQARGCAPRMRRYRRHRPEALRCSPARCRSNRIVGCSRDLGQARKRPARLAGLGSS